ncbi:hypothetical protein ACFQI7_09465 [Paenibacillus allorhizosphaerae]|uniref:Transcription initiation factor TFIID n=1 Tax=Paenibacillus allorhizosphaerae TaxID=2849866 RepID=A0ABM8VIK4_9BACL|nr:hypothetical protein [Paenibacillus allorhizosphaerae]CAG7644262.1 hypothetical protein PAECIP111802_03204 [Paenibacillus allorhizosphaerae]
MSLREKLTAFAGDYAAELEHRSSGEDALSTIYHPVVFLFLGDRTAEDVRHATDWLQRRWHNGAGAICLHAGMSVPASEEPVYGWQLPVAETGSLSERPDIRRRFYEDDGKLLELNVTLRKMVNKIRAMGRSYDNLQRLNIAVVTRLDDPFHVLLPDLTVLMKTVFGESSRSVISDLYVLADESQESEDFAYRSAIGVSLLRELDIYQNREYRYEQRLQVTGEGVRLPAVHPPSPLFDTVYWLSNKDERGIFVDGGMRSGAELVCRLSLLKNARPAGDPGSPSGPAFESYNHQLFKQSITPADARGAVYASAGCAQVTRPNAAIALSVLYHYQKRVLLRLRDNAQAGLSHAMPLLQLDPHDTEREVRGLMPEPEAAMEGMRGLMHADMSFADLRPMTLRQAELALFGDNARLFFEKNIAAAAEAALEQSDPARRLERLIDQKVIQEPALGLFGVYRWTMPGEAGSLSEQLDERIRQMAGRIAQCRVDLEMARDEKVEYIVPVKSSPLAWFSGKPSVKEVIRRLLDNIYSLQWEMALLELHRKLLVQYRDKLSELHRKVKPLVERFIGLEQEWLKLSRSEAAAFGGQAGRNIDEYYGHVVERILNELENRMHRLFYFEHARLGNASVLFAEQEEVWLLRLTDTVRKDLFSHALFHQSFEAELLARANVTTSYDNPLVLTKEDLFRDISRTLDSESAIRADVYHSTHRHRYEEQYYAGYVQSEFIGYAVNAQQTNGSCKLGCIHEERTSSVEKIHLMGGFRGEDLMYFRHGKRYYDSYVENGFQFHSIDPNAVLERQLGNGETA